MGADANMLAQRIDKWLWAARFFKTRSIASEEIGKNRVQVNGQDAKASREVKPGDTVRLPGRCRADRRGARLECTARPGARCPVAL